jgi:hypothetical protein
MVVIKEVDQDVADKLDTQYITAQLPDLANTGIIYVCRSEGGKEDEWTDETGMRYIVIQLPYGEVKASGDVKGLMLAKAKERLGMVA